MAEEKKNGAERLEFDFSKVTAGQMDDFSKKQRRLIYREPLAIVKLAAVNAPADWPEDWSQLPYKTTQPMMKQFAEEAKNFEAPTAKDFRFDVETISAADVEDYMQYAALGDYSKQAEIISKYAVELQKNIPSRLDSWRKGWTGNEQKRYEGMSNDALIALMNADALLEMDFKRFRAVRAAFMDGVLNLGKNLNGQS